MVLTAAFLRVESAVWILRNFKTYTQTIKTFKDNLQLSLCKMKVFCRKVYTVKSAVL